MKHRITTDSMVHEFRLLRNRIEAEVEAPAVVFVTSATDGDGVSLTAYGLAESLSKTKQRTVLVTTAAVTPVTTLPLPDTPRRRRASDRLEGVNHPANDGRLAVVSISPERVATISRSSVAGLVQELRVDHDYVIIDAGNLPKNSFGLLLMASADATLVAFRSGRTQQPADREMLDMLERAEAKVLGVVMTDEATIEHFEHRDEPVAAPEPVTERKPAAMIAARFEDVRSRLGKAI